MSIEIILFITGIIIIAYGILGWKLKVDFKGIKIEVIGELYQWQRYTLFLLGIVCIAVAYLLARGSLLPKEMVAESVSGDQLSITSNVLPTDIFETADMNTSTEVELIVYDDFNNPTYDGYVNSNLWYVISDPGCKVTQQDGYMLLTKDCSLEVDQPNRVLGQNLEALETRLKQIKGIDIPVGMRASTVILAIVDFDVGQWWEASCGILEESEWIGVRFTIYDSRLGTSNLYFADHPIDYNKWYEIQLRVNPETMQFECLVDSEVIGSYTPENGEELRDVLFKRWLDSRGDVQVVTQIDYFRLIPPDG